MTEHIPLDKVYVAAMGTPQDQSVIFGNYFGIAEKTGVPLSSLRGTGFMDLITNYLACTPHGVIAPRPVMRLVGDVLEFCVENAPGVSPISFSGYNIRECGIAACQEIAIVLACAISNIDYILGRGHLNIDEFASKLAATHLSCDRDFFEEIAKFRAIRRMWCRLLGERYGARDPRSLKMKIHVQTTGVGLTLHQPLNNLVRVAYQVLAAALGGVQSMHSAGYDEAYSAPCEEAALLAIRTQQIAQLETNVMNVADPLGGSYFIEKLTSDLEERAWDYLKSIEQRGGFLSALESGWLHGELGKAMIAQQEAVANGQKKIVGVNCFQMAEEPFKVTAFKSDPKAWEKAMVKLEKLRRERDNDKTRQALDQLRKAVESGQNVMRPAIEAMKAYATIGEVGDVYREFFPIWNEPIPM